MDPEKRQGVWKNCEGESDKTSSRRMEVTCLMSLLYEKFIFSAKNDFFYKIFFNLVFP
jgi:hypothetical protein